MKVVLRGWMGCLEGRRLRGGSGLRDNLLDSCGRVYLAFPMGRWKSSGAALPLGLSLLDIYREWMDEWMLLCGGLLGSCISRPLQRILCTTLFT